MSKMASKISLEYQEKGIPSCNILCPLNSVLTIMLLYSEGDKDGHTPPSRVPAVKSWNLQTIDGGDGASGGCQELVVVALVALRIHLRPAVGVLE